jgi:hypothetical protein
MNGVEFDYEGDEFQEVVDNFLSFPSSLQMETQAKIGEIIDKYFENNEVTGRKKSGPLGEVQRWQNILIATQNMLGARKMKIGKELTEHISKPIQTHNNCTEYTNTLYLLLGMKETAFGHPSNSLDPETAIHIVDAQTECSKTTPFVNKARDGKSATQDENQHRRRFYY